MRGARGRRRVVGFGAMLAGMLLAWSPRALALNPALDLSQYAHKAWKISEGFAKGPINAIAQTTDGYLWLGTDFGLLRFDGVKSVSWPPLQDQPLLSGTILNLLTARDGTLWIGAKKGLASWKDGRLTEYAEFAGQYVLALLKDREGSVWAGTLGIPAGKLCAIQKGVIQCFGQDGRFGEGVLSLREYQSDLWVGAITGLWRWKRDSPRLYAMPSQIRDLIEGDNGALWIGLLRGGIYQFDDGKAKASSVQPDGQFYPETLLRDRENSLWIGTRDGGLVHVHQGRTDLFTAADGLSGDVVHKLFEDREGNIWAAGSEGLDRFRDYAVPAISVKQGVATAIVGSVLAARDGSVWLGSSDGLNRWKDGQFTIYRKRIVRPAKAPTRPPVREINDDGLPDNPSESLFQDDRGRIWVATPRGLAWYEDGRFNPVPSARTRMVHNIAEESAGDLWINDQNLGLLHLLGGSLAEQIPWEKLGFRDIASTLIADRVKGGLWLGLFRGGVAYFKDGRIQASITPADGLGEGRVNDFQLDRDGTLWAATEGGLSRVKNGQVVTLTKKNGLPCDLVHWVIEDDDHLFWLHLACGLVRIARRDLEAWTANPNQEPKSTFFDSFEGVRNIGTASGFSPRVSKSVDGKLWFVTYGGVSVIDPRRLPFNKLPPPVHIEQVTADRKPHEATAGLRLPSLIRDIEIDYTALSLVAPEKVRFRYKLEGHDHDWEDAGARRQAFYNDLPPRHYRFRVIACNNSGVWNEAGAAFDFSIDPAYYQTAWFLAACIAAALAALAALYQLRLRYLRQQFDLRMEERVNERTRIARDFHDTLLQSFQGVLMKLSVVSYQIPNHPEVQEKLKTIVTQARQAVTEGRDAVQGLRSSTVVTNDLARAIGALGEELSAAHAGENCPEFCLRVEGASRDLAPLVRDDVHRIACEAVRNAFRHAQAGRIEVEIQYDRRQLCLRVVDNGKGIDPKMLAGDGRPGHFGLAGMQERAKLVGGKLAVRSKLDSGTEAELTIPAGIAYSKSPAAHGSTASEES